jgi:putative metallohydrolase (TIGR04338 family)
MPKRIAPDKQTLRLYSAEGVLKKDSEDLSLRECRKYVREIISNDYARVNFNFRTPVRVGDGRGWEMARATFDDNDKPIIQLPRWARNKYVILHEVAHHLIMRIEEDEIGHSPLFASVLLDLVRIDLGVKAYYKLKLAFLFRRVKLAY